MKINDVAGSSGANHHAGLWCQQQTQEHKNRVLWNSCQATFSKPAASVQLRNLIKLCKKHFSKHETLILKWQLHAKKYSMFFQTPFNAEIESYCVRSCLSLKKGGEAKIKTKDELDFPN